MISDYIIFATSICFISWFIALLAAGLVKQLNGYEKLSNLNFVRSEAINKWLLVGVVKWLIINTPLKFFNQAIKLGDNNVDLYALRHQMTVAEINHLLGFVFVMAFVFYMSLFNSLLFGLVILVANILMNLCPALIQQQNKRRLDKLISRKSKL